MQSSMSASPGAGLVAPIPLDTEKMDAVCRRLPPLPPLASRLIAVFSRPDADLQEAVALIRSDAVFSGELLRLANSAEFAAYEPFEDATRAVLYLGFERVQSAVRRITYSRLMKDAFGHPVNAEIHRSNLASAYLCDRIMAAYGQPEDADDFCPYSLGLFLKIGALVLLRGFPVDYPRFLGKSCASAELLLQAEQTLFGFHHVDVSLHLVKYWDFPNSFQAMVAGHMAEPDFTDPLLIGEAARIAHLMAGSLGFTFLRGLRYPRFEELTERLPSQAEAEFPKDAQSWRSAIGVHLGEVMRNNGTQSPG